MNGHDGPKSEQAETARSPARSENAGGPRVFARGGAEARLIRMERTDVLKRIILVLILSTAGLPALFSRDSKVTVVADKAAVHIEPDENSTRIDVIAKGTVLTLFDSWEDEKAWLYVTYNSAKWKAKVTGFIKSECVVRGEREPERTIPGKPETQDSEVPKRQKKKRTQTDIEHDTLPSIKDFIKSKKSEPAGKETETEKIPQPEMSETEAKERSVRPDGVPQDTIRDETPATVAEIPAETGTGEARRIKPASGREDKAYPYVPAEQIIQEEKAAASPESAESDEEKKGPEIIPVRTAVTLAASVVPPRRRIHAAEARQKETRAYAVIKEYVQELETSGETAEAVRRAESLQRDLPQKQTLLQPEAEAEKADEAEKQETPPVRRRKPPPELAEPRLSGRKIGPFTLGFGYGPSFGGIGAFLQINTKAGFSIHAGAGYYPATYYYPEFEWLRNRVLFSAGIKYYLPFGGGGFRPYLNLQYGGLSVEAVQIETGIWHGQKSFDTLQKNLYGPSLLGGIEWRLGFAGLNGSMGVSYNTTPWNYWDRNLFLNGDLSLLFCF